VRRKDGSFATAVLQLWHPEADRVGLADNNDRLVDTLRGTRVRAAVGLTALQQAAGTAVAAGQAS
jgi:hypothetical protein